MLRRVLLALVLAIVVTAGVVAIDFLGAEPVTDDRVLGVLHADEPDETDTEVRDVAVLQCPDCKVLETGASGDAARQRSEIAAMVEQDADVIVVEPVAGADADLAAEARAVPVVAVGEPLLGAEHFVGYRPGALTGALAAAIVNDVGPDARVLAVGPVPEADLSVLESTVTEVVETDLAGLAERRLATFDAVVVLAEADVPAVADALAGVPAATRPGLAASGGGLDAARRLVLGRQTWLAPVDVRRQWELAATAGAEMATGVTPETDDDVDGVPADLLRPRLVTLDNLTDTLVRSGEVSLDELCAGSTAGRCTALGFR